MPLLMYVAVALLTGFDGLYGQDAYEYHRYAESLKNWMLTGEHPGSFFWPVLFPLASALASLILPTSLALQSVSAFSFIGILLILQKWISTENSLKNIYLLTSVGISTYFLRMSLLGMSDLLAALFVLLAFYWSTRKKSSLFNWAIIALFSGLAVGTRYPTSIILTPLLVMEVFKIIRQKNWMALPVMLLAGLLPLFPQLILNATLPEGFLHHEGLTSWSFSHFFDTQFATSNGHQSHLFPNILVVFSPLFHPGYFLLGLPLLALVFLLRIRISWSKEQCLVLVCILLYLFFLAGVPIQNMRFFTPVYPLVVWFLYPFFERVAESFNLRWVVSTVVVSVFLQIVLFGYSFNKFFQRHFIERQIAEVIAANNAQHVYCFGLQGALSTRVPNVKITSFYYQEIDEFEPKSLVVFNETAFAEQWKNHAVMRNWNRLNAAQSLSKIADFNDGYSVYRTN